MRPLNLTSGQRQIIFAELLLERPGACMSAPGFAMQSRGTKNRGKTPRAREAMEGAQNMPQPRTKAEPRRQKRAKKPLFSLDLDLGIDVELDFDADDFDLIDGNAPAPEKQRDVRILRPRLDRADLTQRVAYDNAEAFAKQIDLTLGARTFAWVSGNFIFGDIVEALITARRVGVKRLYICSLSFSQENIDSLKNVMQLMGDELQQITLVFSGYQYSHEKYDLVPYMYQELDDPQNRVQIAFGRWHAKIITMETVHGHTITIHGSANMRSSNSIEQLMVEVDDRELHDFNARLMDDIAARFGTINHGAAWRKLKPLAMKEAWEITAQRAGDEANREGDSIWQAEVQAAAAEAAEPGAAAPGANTPPPRAGG